MSRPADTIESESPANQHRGGLLRCLGTIVRGLATIASIGAVLFVALVLFSWVHPAVELATHCCLHVLLLVTALLPILLSLRMNLSACWVGLAWLYLLWLVQPWQLLPTGRGGENLGLKNSLKVMSWNVLSVNRSFDEIEHIIQQVDPDLLILIEVRPGFLDKLPLLAQRYPQSIVMPSWMGGGIAVLSRDQSTRFEVQGFGYTAQPAVVVDVSSSDAQSALQVVAMHTYSPMPISRTPHRDRQIDNFIEWARPKRQQVCLVGDLNITPWTRSFKRLLDNGFRDSRIGAGNCASWPSQLGSLGIPIDHALCRGDCLITQRRVLPAGPGSDHLPIAFEIQF